MTKRRFPTRPLFLAPLALAIGLSACVKKGGEEKKADSGVESQRIPDELLEPRRITVPHCTKSGETVVIDYNRMKKQRESVGLAFPLAVCLNGLEGKTKNQISSVHFFVDLTFPSEIGLLAENIGRLSSIVLGSQSIKTTVTNPKGEQGTLEYFLNPLITFNFAQDICKLRVSQLSLNVKDVKVKDLPVGPKWLPQGVADGLASMGLNLVRVLDDWNVVNGRIIPIINTALEGALAGFGCDPAQTRAFTWTQDFAANKGHGTWYPAPPATPTPLPTEGPIAPDGAPTPGAP